MAEYIERFYVEHGGRDLGARTHRDGAEGLRADFTYDHVTPPVAMEITGLIESAVRQLAAELGKLEVHLDIIAKAEGLGTWIIGILVGSNDVKALKPLLEKLLRRGGARDEAALFRPTDAPGDALDETGQLLVELGQSGLVSALRLPGDGSVSVHPPVVRDQDLIDSSTFGVLLSKCIADNRDKLADARPRETHLVVTVGQMGATQILLAAPVPALPAEIDVLWVMLGYYAAKYTPRLWRAARGDNQWLLMADPLGGRPRLHHSSPASD